MAIHYFVAGLLTTYCVVTCNVHSRSIMHFDLKFPLLIGSVAVLGAIEAVLRVCDNDWAGLFANNILVV